MSISFTNTTAEWIADDKEKTRVPLDKAVSKVIGHTKISNGLPKELTKKIVDYLESYSCFGESEWTKFFGRVDPAPLLPHDFSEIWNGSCPIYPEKKLRDTHFLVYIPSKVNDKPYTLRTLGHIFKPYFQKKNDDYEYTWSGIADELGDKPENQSRWVLMTKEVLPESCNLNYNDQQKMVAELAAKSLCNYDVPGTLEYVSCVLSQYLILKIRIFNTLPWTYTHCKEKIEGNQTVVGGFIPNGLYFGVNFFCVHESIGIVAVRTILGS